MPPASGPGAGCVCSLCQRRSSAAEPPAPTHGAPLALHGGHWALTGTVPPGAGSPPTVGLLLPARGSPPCLGRGLASQAQAVPPRSPPWGRHSGHFHCSEGKSTAKLLAPPKARKCSGPLLSPRHRGQAQPRTPHHPLIPPNSTPKQEAGHGDTLLSRGGWNTELVPRRWPRGGP